LTPPPAPVEPVVEPAPAPKRTTPHRHISANKSWFLGLSMGDRTNVTAVCAQRAEIACQASLHVIMPRAAAAAPDTDGDEEGTTEPRAAEPAEPNPEEKAVAKLSTTKLAAYCSDFPAPTCETPLVVAFDNQPIEFAPAGSDRFAFVPGDPAATDWPTATTPWIALDLDGDGNITSGAELFGSSTVLPSGARAVNGFSALAALDANGDGVIDARDPMFAKLVLWSDRNGDHHSTPDELRPLSGSVTSISLSFSLDPRCNQHDDCEGERGTMRWRDTAGAEHSGAVVDVYIPR
jgi:hypothetical protein